MNRTEIRHQETLKGMIEKVVYHLPDNGYSVFRVRADGQQALVTMVGHSPVGDPGEYIEATGRWTEDSQYGRQFRAADIRIASPDTLDGIERYLASGAISGIGKTYAKRLIAYFGQSVLEVIEREPERLTQVAGIGQARADKIKKSFDDQKHIRNIMIFLHQHGISGVRAARIYTHYGAEAIDTISHNPYQLVLDISGIGFASADRLALRLGIGQHSPFRVRAAIWHLLGLANAEGDCGLPIEKLIDKASELTDLPDDFIEKNIREGVREGRLISDAHQNTHFVFPAWIYRSEWRISQLLKRLAAGKLPWSIDQIEQKITRFEKEASLMLSLSQREALSMALCSKVQIITGGPGVGKTTLVKAILFLLADAELNMAICAPTGRAARRLSESTGQSATTIHRLLGAVKGSYQFHYNELQQLSVDVIIIDECSMIDIPLMLSLLKAIPEHAAVIFLGDIDQLPSIGPGRVFGDMIDAKRISTVFLTEVFRQALSSDIIRVVHQIKLGQMPSFGLKGKTSDCFFIETEQTEDILSKIVSLVIHRIPKAFGVDARQDIQVITPMNRGPLGTQAINEKLQYQYNDSGQLGIQRAEQFYYIGDKVMQLENDYDHDVFNGDIGYIVEILPEEKKLIIDFDRKMVEYDFASLDSISLAYAITVHKSQGSEYPVVVFVVTMQHFSMLERHLLYTALSRGRQLVVIVGQRKALDMAIEKNTLPDRHSRLMTFLME